MNSKQLRSLIVFPVLTELGTWSQEAEDLICGTIAQESQNGEYIKQIGGGPALGICQMEPATHDDIWNNFLEYNPHLVNRLSDMFLHGNAEEMVYNLRYAVAMCRIHYLRVSDAIPKTLEGQAEYWKQHYNTKNGKGSPHEYIDNYERFHAR